MAKRISLSCGPIEASGATKTEARAALDAKIEAALTANYIPIFVEWRGEARLAVRTPVGWEVYRIENGVRTGSSHTSGKDNRLALSNELRLDLAQMGWRHDGDPEVEDSPAVLPLDGNLCRDWLSWVGFQRRWRRLQAAGFDANQAHRFACEGEESTAAAIAQKEAA